MLCDAREKYRFSHIPKGPPMCAGAVLPVTSPATVAKRFFSLYLNPCHRQGKAAAAAAAARIFDVKFFVRRSGATGFCPRPVFHGRRRRHLDTTDIPLYTVLFRMRLFRV